MRIWILVTVLGAGVLSGCGDSGEHQAGLRDQMRLLQTEVQTLQVQNEQLRTQDSLRNDVFSEYTRVVNQTLGDMEALTRREGMLREIRMDIEAGEQGQQRQNLSTIEERINDNLAAIESYIRESKRQRDELKRMVEEPPQALPAPEVARFEETIRRLNSLVEEKERTITELRHEAQALLSRIDLLQTENTELTAENTELKQAFYVIGTHDELQEKGIVERTGGVLGIGRTTQLDMLDPVHFRAADVEVREIVLGSNRARYEILSSHKTSKQLYDFAEREGMVYLTVYDPNAFWQVSRYLVVARKE